MGTKKKKMDEWNMNLMSGGRKKRINEKEEKINEVKEGMDECKRKTMNERNEDKKNE